MKKITLGTVWNRNWHRMEVTKIFKNGKVQITETWLREEDGKPRKAVKNYGVGEDEDGQYAYSIDYPEYRLYAGGADFAPETEEQETTNTESKEEKNMKNTNNAQVTVTEITVDGIKYTTTRPGYYYKKVDGKQTRIGKAEWEQAFDKYITDAADEASQWDAEDEIKERERKQGESDKQAEKAVNKKKKKTTRRSKDIAFIFTPNGDESRQITLTAKQVDFVKRLPESNFYEDGLESVLWIDCLADDLGGQFTGKPMTIGAMVSTLREKGLVEVARDDARVGKPKMMTFTELGKVVASELGLN